MQGVRVARLDHLGIVAGVCREIGLAGHLDGLARPSQQQMSIGNAMVATILNGLGFSDRQLYLVAQFLATKPAEHLLRPGITAEMPHDDCLGRSLDWLHEHDPTALLAGIARQACQCFGIPAHQVHVDTTSFAVTGEYDRYLELAPKYWAATRAPQHCPAQQHPYGTRAAADGGACRSSPLARWSSARGFAPRRRVRPLRHPSEMPCQTWVRSTTTTLLDRFEHFLSQRAGGRGVLAGVEVAVDDGVRLPNFAAAELNPEAAHRVLHEPGGL
jgi:Domain of unknown function (DUF4277)